jgi:hypothetical protein
VTSISTLALVLTRDTMQALYFFAHLSLHVIFFGFAALLFGMIMFDALVWPYKPYLMPADHAHPHSHMLPCVHHSPTHNVEKPLLQSTDEKSELQPLLEATRVPTHQQFDLARQHWDKSFVQQLLTFDWAINAAFVCISIAFLQLYMGTLPMVLSQMGDGIVCHATIAPLRIRCCDIESSHACSTVRRWHVCCAGQSHHATGGAGNTNLRLDARQQGLRSELLDRDDTGQFDQCHGVGTQSAVSTRRRSGLGCVSRLSVLMCLQLLGNNV